MELRQLEYFTAVVDEGGFTRAAEKVHVAQPGISAQIRRLEREFGQDLLDRSGRTVRLTEVGTAVLPYARAALAAVRDAKLAVAQLTGLVRGHLAVGTVTSHNIDLPALLAGFHRDHPDVEITLAEASTEDLIEGLRTGRLNTALLALGPTPPEGLELHPVVDDTISAAVAPDHELADRDSISLLELRDRPLVSLPTGTGMRGLLDAACQDAGFRPRIAFEAGTPGVIAELAAHGLGIAIVPTGLARVHAELHALDITHPQLRGGLAFAWRADGPISPATQAFVRRARQLPLA